jgi:cell division topological specificity factor
MSGLWDRLTGQADRSSARAAKDRLIVVLSHDRSEIEPGILEKIKDEIVRVISEHVDVDPSTVQVHLSSQGREQHLQADIPLPGPSRRRRKL